MTPPEFPEWHFRAHCRGALRAALHTPFKVSRLRATIPHVTIHAIFSGDSEKARALRAKYPLEGTETEEVVNPSDPEDRVTVEVVRDWSAREVPWNIDVRGVTP